MESVVHTPASSGMTPPKPMRKLACVLCQHRKIKCDRNMPCSNCIKASVTCTPSTPAPPRKRRRPNQDLQERLARCEELLKEYASTSNGSNGINGSKGSPPSSYVLSPASSTTTTATAAGDPYLRRSAPRLVQEKGNMRFMDNPLWGHLYDELHSMREILDESQDKDEMGSPPSDAPTPDGHSDMLLGDVQGVQLDKLHPDPVNIFRLWHVFLERVNPFTKVIHIPTMQPYFQEAASPSRNIPSNIEALLFAIYSTSVAALDEDECISVLGYNKQDALRKFTQGVRVSLHQLGFLVNYDLATVQALILYMVSLQGRFDRHAAWVLGGMVVRLAQKMGMHRDGETMGLSPFDTEIRRRVWWAIMLLDVKTALLSGLGSSFLSVDFDTKEPTNINDSDFCPTQTDPIVNQQGPTDMLICLIMCRITGFICRSGNFLHNDMLTVADIIKSNNGETDTPHLERFKEQMVSLETTLTEVVDSYCDPMAGPLHVMGWNMYRDMLDKIGTLTRGSDPPQWVLDIQSPDDSMFAFTVNNIDRQFKAYRMAESTGYIWYLKSHFLPEIHAFLVSQLSRRTTGSLVDQSWELVRLQYHYHPELYNMKKKMFMSMAVMAIRAWSKRRAAVLTQTGNSPDTPAFIQKLEQLMPRDSHSPVKMETTPAPEVADQQQQHTLESMRWEPMFGGYVDFANIEWDNMFGSMQEDAGVVLSGGGSNNPFGV